MRNAATEPLVLQPGPARPVHVAIVYCSGDMVHADFTNCLVILAVYTRNRGVLTNLVNPKADVATGRHNGVVVAKQTEADYLFFVDSDMMIPPDTIVRLLEHGKPVVGASYCQRRLPFRMTHTELDGGRGTFSDTDAGIREVARIPTGCMLIDMAVFNGMEPPYFKWGYPGDGRVVSEDNTFCDRVREAGHSVWLDCDLTKEVRHIGTYPYGYQDRVQPEQGYPFVETGIDQSDAYRREVKP